MPTEHQWQKTAKEHLCRSFLILLVEETCQHAKQLCKEAAIAREISQDITLKSYLARQRRRQSKLPPHSLYCT